jgi:serine phosphatase RsbU (regulator of sigma subunit)
MEQEMAMEVAHRAALALDNARLYTEEHRGALTLQRSLLPELEPVEHLAASALYLPATNDAGVGGDWYDLFRLPDGSAGVAVGDAMGHDMRAAASMGQLRSVLRSYAFDLNEPGEVLDKVDRLVQRFSMARLATAFFAQLRRHRSRRWVLRYANAGHPPPLIRWPDGAVEFLDGGSSILVGAPLGSPRPTTEMTLPEGTTLLLYTDGLVDSNDRPIDEGLACLLQLVERAGSVSPEQLCSRIAAEMVGAGRPDDVALLAVELA